MITSELWELPGQMCFENLPDLGNKLLNLLWNWNLSLPSSVSSLAKFSQDKRGDWTDWDWKQINVMLQQWQGRQALSKCVLNRIAA